MEKVKVKDAIDELNALEKSQQQLEDNGISALEKALADFDDFDGFEKSQDGDEDDKGGEPDDEDKEDDKEGDEGDQDGDADQDKVKKSLEDDELENELVKASEAYAELEGSVNALAKSQGEQADELRSALASLTSLTMAVGRGVVALNKSIREFGGQPIAAGKKPLLGEGREKVTEGLAKSKAEVVELVKSAIEQDKLDIRWLSKVSVHGPECLSEEVKTIIGL